MKPLPYGKSHYAQRGRKLKLKQGRASAGYLLSFFPPPRDLPLPLRIRVAGKFAGQEREERKEGGVELLCATGSVWSAAWR